MYQHKFIRPLFLLLLILATSCHMQEANTADAPDYSASKVAYTDEASATENVTQDAIDRQRTMMLIRRADIRMQVEDHARTGQTIHRLVNASGGFVGAERSNGDNNYNQTTLEIRVPNQAFDSLVHRIAGLGIQLDYKNISSKDVSEEYVDLQARIKSKKASEETYMNILRSSKKIADVLEVQNHIRQVREEIEAGEGRLRFLNDRVSLSTISVSFYENQPVAAAVASGTGFGTKIKIAFLRGWQAIQAGLVGLTHTWPLLLLAFLFFLFRKKLFPQTKRTKTQP